MAAAGADPAHDHVQETPVLDLEPGWGPAAGLVGGVEALDHDALQAVADADREHGLPAAGKRRRDMHVRAGQGQGVENGPPPRVGLAGQRPAVQVHDVEDQVGHRNRGHQARGGRTDVHPPLQELEAGLAVLVEGDDLSVEHRRVMADL